MSNPNEQLARRLSSLDATAILVGSMIGSGIFIAPSLMAKNIAAPGVYLGLWLLAGVFTLLGAFSYAELAAMMPAAGGQYVYLRRAFGPLTGFLYGWTLLLVIQSGFIAAVAIAFAKYLGIFIPGLGEKQILLSVPLGGLLTFTFSSAQAVALGVIAVLTLINLRGVVAGAAVQNVFTGLKLLALWALVAGILVAGKGSFANFRPLWSTELPRTVAEGAVKVSFLAALGVAASKALFCYDAWNTVTFAAAEVRDPARSLPRALVGGTVVTTLTYVLAAAGYLYLVPLERMAGVPENRIAAVAAQALLGDTGGRLIAAAILVSTFGCINGMILGGARVLYAMGKDGLLFASAASLNRRKAPGVALVLLAAWSAVLTVSGSYDALLTYTTFASLLFNAATAACVFVLRRRCPDEERPYRAFGHPVSTALFIAVACFFVLYIVRGDPRSSLYGLLLVLLGVPVYALIRRARAPR